MARNRSISRGSSGSSGSSSSGSGGSGSSTRSSSRGSSKGSSGGGSGVDELDEDVTAGGAERAQHCGRRRLRSSRSLEEKASHWRLVRQPAFQAWARATAFAAKPQPVPEDVLLLLGRGSRTPLELRLDEPLPLERTTSQPPPILDLSSPVGCNWRRNPDGGAESFVRWDRSQDADRGVGGSAAPLPLHARPPSSGAVAATEVERRALAEEVKRRAGEQCMPLYVDCFVRRQALRCPPRACVGGAGGTPAGPSSRRALAQEANRFDECYGKTQDAIQRHLCFTPPKRRASVGIGQVQRVAHGVPVSP